MDIRIESADNPRVKAALRLRKNRGRAKQHRILIDGTREVVRALDAGVEVLALFLNDQKAASESVLRVSERLSESGAARLLVRSEVFQRLAYGDRDDGVIAVARPPNWTLDQLPSAGDMVIAVLDNLEKPGNIGAIVRTADAAGLAAVIVAELGTDLYNPNAIRASLGTIFTVPTVATTSEAAAAWLRAGGFQIVTCRIEASAAYSEMVYGQRTAIVLGSEANGLSDFWREKDISSVALPLRGQADSLNVSATAAVMFYEVMRQRARA
jgi:TrmH family RNA methyltransferase